MKKIIIGLAAFFLIFVLVIVPLVSRFYLKDLALKEAGELLGTRVELGSASLHPLSGHVVLSGLTLYHPERKAEKIAEIGKVILNLAYGSLFRGEMGLIGVELKDPKLIYQTDARGEWEISGQIPLLRRGKDEKRM